MAEREWHGVRTCPHIGLQLFGIGRGIARIVEQLALDRESSSELSEQVNDLLIVRGGARTESGDQLAERPALRASLPVRGERVRLVYGGALKVRGLAISRP